MTYILIDDEIDDAMIDPDVLTDEDIEEIHREQRHQEWVYWWETRGRFGL